MTIVNEMYVFIQNIYKIIYYINNNKHNYLFCNFNTALFVKHFFVLNNVFTNCLRHLRKNIKYYRADNKKTNF